MNEYPIGKRVVFWSSGVHEQGDPIKATIIGKSWKWAYLTIYILLLDEPLSEPGYEGWTGVSVPASSFQPL